MILERHPSLQIITYRSPVVRPVRCFVLLQSPGLRALKAVPVWFEVIRIEKLRGSNCQLSDN
jgi:hypothetical protein